MAAPASRSALRALRSATRPARCTIRPISRTCIPRQSLRAFSNSARRRDDASDLSEPGHDVRYTTDLYPELKRDSRFTELKQEHVDFFKKTLEDESAVIDGLSKDASDDLEPFNRDWMKKYRGRTKVVLKPKSVEEVSKVLKYCNDNMLAVVPQGGNSGLVGGSVPVFDEVVINLTRMNKIRSFDDVSGILVIDGGVIMENADNFLKEHGHIYPLDLGAKGSAQVGGNVAANAGGLRFLRYGSLHGNVLGLEAVLPDGTILNDLSKLRKNNTGYDLKQLFIGGEGTIGIITGVSIQCPQRSKAVNVAYFGLESYEKVQKAYKEAKLQLGEILSAFELMDAASQGFVHRKTEMKRPIEGDYPFYCLIETSGSNGEHDNEKLEAFLEHVMGEEIVADGVVAQDGTQIAELWGWREGITEAMGHFGATYKYDLSIPIKDLYKVVEDTRERLESKQLIGDDKVALGVVGFGHMGDGNIHLNIPVRRYDKDVEAAIEPWVYEWIQKKEGSISAEHGLGIAKAKYIGYQRDETMLKLMHQIKQLYDPNGIMMPYKYLSGEGVKEHTGAATS
ncbi:D-lactate ferricytochrome c oxidoreductase [Exophiala xenobiotica]|uniref:D-lactate ferricytochrome c oxidoreductase n=1 Tax=Lithohypha guttulata TaxID=1690604 RepID=A0ABR0JZA3_9EURO|nr:D-lactate ferricytochrome c oxidoreductase [Lithohypha guttulata]KAK5311443.1 D-lactate ferricytochrome c oxidoreductase [Exophiala xenobiotica]